MSINEHSSFLQVMCDKKLKRISKDEWLNCGLKALENSGVDGVHIDTLSQQMGVATSGFWEFNDRHDLLTHMLEYWAYEYSEVVTENRSLTEGFPIKRLENIMRIVRDYEFSRFEAAIFVWVQSDPVARKVFDHVYKVRMNFIGNIFLSLDLEVMSWICEYSCLRVTCLGNIQTSVQSQKASRTVY
jgi:hypothetical protein